MKIPNSSKIQLGGSQKIDEAKNSPAKSSSGSNQGQVANRGLGLKSVAVGLLPVTTVLVVLQSLGHGINNIAAAQMGAQRMGEGGSVALSEPLASHVAPTPESWGTHAARDPGFSYQEPRIDDEVAHQAAANLRSRGYDISTDELQAAAALEIQYDRTTTHNIGSDYAVPGWVAQRGLQSAHRADVERMVNEMVRITGLGQGMAQQILSVYDEGIQSQRFAEQSGMQPYGLRPGDLGEWE